MWWVPVTQASPKGQLYFDEVDQAGVNRSGAHERGAKHPLINRRC